MEFRLLDVVRLKEDRPDAEVKKGYKGTIVDVLNKGEAFTVEFLDENNETIMKSIFSTFYPEELELVESYRSEKYADSEGKILSYASIHSLDEE